MRKKRNSQTVVVPEAHVIDASEIPANEGQEEGLMMGGLDKGLPVETWSVRPPSRIEPEEKLDEFPLPPVFSFEWNEDWNDIIFPPYPDEVTENDIARDSDLGSSATA